MQTQRVLIANLILDPRLQFRANERPDVVADWAERLKAGEKYPPVLVYKDEAGTYRVVDGFHRTRAHIAAGLDEIEAEIRHGEFALAQEAAAKANTNHGIMRTIYDKQKAGAWWLATYPDVPIRELARRSSLSHTFLNDIKKEAKAKAAEPQIETIAEVPDLETLDDQTLGRLAAGLLVVAAPSRSVRWEAECALDARAEAALVAELEDLPIEVRPDDIGGATDGLWRTYTPAAATLTRPYMPGEYIQIEIDGTWRRTVLYRVHRPREWEGGTWCNDAQLYAQIAAGAPLFPEQTGRTIKIAESPYVIGRPVRQLVWGGKPTHTDEGEPWPLTEWERNQGVPVETPEDLARHLTAQGSWPGYGEPQNSAAKAGEAAARANEAASTNPHPEGSIAWRYWWAAWWLDGWGRGDDSPYQVGFRAGLMGADRGGNPYPERESRWERMEWYRGWHVGQACANARNTAITVDRRRATCSHGTAILPGGDGVGKLLDKAELAKLAALDLGRRRARLIGAIRRRSGSPDWVAEAPAKNATPEALPALEAAHGLDPWPAMTHPGVICAYCATSWDCILRPALEWADLGASEEVGGGALECAA